MAEFKEQFNEKFKVKLMEQWIRDGIDSDAVLYAEDLGRYLADSKYSTSQIRNVYGEVKRIELKKGGILNIDSYSSFLMLKPKLAYAAKRSEKNRGKALEAAVTFKHVLTDAIEVIIKNERRREECFKNFCLLFEAILAYHKAFGGKNT
jgi:CRISPR-associated protein Csm2